MLKILVTGGAGFIGSHTCLALLQKGYDVIVIDSLINSSYLSLNNVEKIVDIFKPNIRSKLIFIKGDLNDINFLNKVFLEEKNKGFPVNAVIHFAGLKSVSESIKYPLKYWRNNIISTLNLIKCMDENNCRTIVFSSSAAIYEYCNSKLIDEEMNINPINSYGNTKATIEKILNDLHKSNSEWKISILRYFNPIGAHESGLLGENPIGIPNNIFPLILQVATGKKESLKIYGNTWPTKDGTGIRDYIHVMDLAEGHLAALEYLFSKKSHIISLNLGTGKGNSVLELINMFEKTNRVTVHYDFVGKRDGDLSRVVADNSLARKTLNWIPERSLEDMCRDGWKWQKLNPEGYC